MPRAFDRGVPPVDKNPLISGTNYSDPQGIIGDAAGFFGQQVREGIPTVIRDITGIDITGVVEFMDWIVAQFGELFNLANWLEIIQPILDLFDQLIADVGTDTFPIISELVTFLSGLFDGAGSVLDWLEGIVPFNLPEVLGQFETFLTALTDRETWLTTLQTLIDALTSITNFPSWVTILKTIVNGLLGLGESPLADLTAWLSWLWNQFGASVETFLKPIFTWLNWLWTQFGSASETFLKPVFNFLKWLWDQFGAAVETFLKPIFTWLSTANLQSLNSGIINTLWSLLNGGAEGIGKTLADVLNSIGDFVEGLVPAITGIPGALGIGQITSWAEDVLTRGLTWADFKTIFGEIPEDILGVLPIANINLINPELMTQGGFDTATTLAPGTGWAWDGTNTHSGSGGSAKVTGNGTARSLYSNQSVSVAAGDKVLISCWVKSTGTVGSGAITLSVVEFSGLAQGATTLIGSSGASAGWVQIGVGTTYTVPAGVTTLRVKVAVTSGAASGSSVWFDDISVKKTGLLSGDWMQGVLGTMIEDLQAAIDQLVQGIKGAGIGSGTLVAGAATSIKAALQSIFTTLFGPLNTALPTSLISNPLLATAIPGLSASKITEGDFPSDRIRTRSIVTDKIATDAVTTNEIGPLAVTSAELGTDAVTNAKIAADAVGTNEIAPLAVTTAELGTDAVTTAKIATNAVTANEIADQTITTALLDPTVVPSIATSVKATTVGTGAVLARMNPAGAHIAAASGTQTFGSTTNPFFNTLTRSTPDITYPTSSVTYSGTTYTFYTGEFVVTFPGWYLCEVGLRVNVGNGTTSLGGPGSVVYTGYYNFTPVLYRKPSGGSNAVFRWGTEITGFAAAGGGSRFARFANSSWIVYLAAGDTVQAGYDAGVIDNGSSVAPRLGFFGCDNSGNDSYFSIALLNRS